MNPTPLTPTRPRARPARVYSSATAAARQFFEANPSEFLTFIDMEARFGLTRKQVYEVVEVLRGEGLVQTGTMVWVNPLRAVGEE